MEALLKLLPAIITWPPIINWRTSTVGLLMVIAGVCSLLGIHVAGITISTDPWTLISGGFGLLLAKDGVVHSTVAQVEKATEISKEK
jgi:hypothetical protein